MNAKLTRVALLAALATACGTPVILSGGVVGDAEPAADRAEPEVIYDAEALTEVVAAVADAGCGDDSPAAPASCDDEARGAAVTLASLVEEMTDLARLSRLPSPAYTAWQASSRDPGPADGDAAAARSSDDAGHFVRDTIHEGRREHVLLDVAGPGALVRVWSSNPQGTLRVYVDGAPAPAVEAPMLDLLTGRAPGFLAPLAHKSSGGFGLYFPIPYARRCEVTVDDGRALRYHVGYRTYAAGTAVRSYSARAHACARPALTHASEVLGGREPAWKPTAASRTTPIRLSVEGEGAARVELAAAPGGSMLRALRLSSSTGDLRAALLVMTFDGEVTVRAPLGDFFGAGPGASGFRALTVEASADGAFVSRWPMPYRERAVIELRGTGGSALALAGEALDMPAPWGDESLYFHAAWRCPEAPSTSGWTLASLRGRGVYVGTALDVTSDSGASWGDGDDEVYVDGAARPGLAGTGTADYFGYAQGELAPFEHAYHAVTFASAAGGLARASLQRWHVLDAIPFERSLRFDFETPHDGRVAYDAVVYWYARPGSTGDLPDACRVPPPR